MNLGSILNAALFSILMLVCEGHVGQIHPKSITLEQLIRRSECILVVKKAKPFTRIVKTELDDTKRYPPHESPRFSYKVVEVLKDESDAKPAVGAKIEVVPAHDRMMLNLSRRYHLEGVHKSPILEFYNDGAARVEKREKFIIFLRRNGEERNYVFAAGDAVDDIGKKSVIDSALDLQYRMDSSTYSR